MDIDLPAIIFTDVPHTMVNLATLYKDYNTLFENGLHVAILKYNLLYWGSIVL